MPPVASPQNRKHNRLPQIVGRRAQLSIFELVVELAPQKSDIDQRNGTVFGLPFVTVQHVSQTVLNRRQSCSREVVRSGAEARKATLPGDARPLAGQALPADACKGTSSRLGAGFVDPEVSFSPRPWCCRTCSVPAFLRDFGGVNGWTFLLGLLSQV